MTMMVPMGIKGPNTMLPAQPAPQQPPPGRPVMGGQIQPAPSRNAMMASRLRAMPQQGQMNGLGV